MIISMKFSIAVTQQLCSSSDTSDLHSGGIYFVSRLEHHLS